MAELGALPLAAWTAVLNHLSAVEVRPDPERSASVLQLRRVCKGLREMVAEHCRGGAGWLDLSLADKRAQLDRVDSTGIGRALVVSASGDDWAELAAAVAAAATAVGRGHMVCFSSMVMSDDPPPAEDLRAAETVLLAASNKAQLLDADLNKGEESGWSLDAMAALSHLALSPAEQATVARIAGARSVQRIRLRFADWADLADLSRIREVDLYKCDAVKANHLALLADVPRLTVHGCAIKSLPAMRNDWLEVFSCPGLASVAGLAAGRVGRLDLRFLMSLKTVSAVGKMQPPPRTVVLEHLKKVRDVSALKGVCHLRVINCRSIDQAKAAAALEGAVGTFHWE